MKNFQVRRSGAAGGARVAALSAERLLLDVAIYFRNVGAIVWDAMETT
jgi:hypothetical protein